VVVYKVDRLTRSLADFAKMVEVFDAHGISFVAVTQQFNTTTSMGRLTLNVLLSFAQFEREVTGERIRDKIAASKRKGMWMGGCPPLGYDVADRRLVVNPKEAEVVKLIYETYLLLRSVRHLKEHLERRGIISKIRTSKTGGQTGGCSFSRGALYELLANPLYIGEVRHKKERHPGQHEAILPRDLWEQVQQRLSDTAIRSGTDEPKCIPSPLAGKLFDEHGGRLTPSHTVKGGRHYRYYVSRNLIRSSAKGKKGWRLTALESERSVITAASSMLADQAATVAAVLDAETSTVAVEAALQAAEVAKKQLDSDLDKSAVIARLVYRVELRKEAMQVALDLGSFVDDEHRELRGGLKLTRLVPLQVRRWGFEMRLVVGGGLAPSPKADPALLKAVARGFRWFNEIATGQATSAADIARRENLDKHYVSRMIPLAFLAPSIVEVISRGAQDPSITTERVTRGVNLPFDWSAQQDLLENQSAER